MSGQVICVAQQKGGAGKSTLLSCIGVKMAGDGAKVCLIDTDPQKSCVEWAVEQDISNLDVLDLLDEDQLEKIIDAARDKYDVVLIDTPGYDSRMATYAIQEANLILIPTGTSKKDVTGAAKTYLHATNITKRNREQPEIYLCLWKVKAGTVVLDHAEKAILDANLPLIEAKVPSLVGFDVMSWNGGMPEGPAKKALNSFIASMQIDKLLDYYKGK